MKLSIGIAVLNEEKRLPEQFKLFDAQTVKPEIVFLDGGSTDNSMKLMKDYAKKNKNVKVFKATGKYSSTANALNQAWDHSTGDLYVFAAVDYKFGPDFTKNVCKSIKKVDYDVYKFPATFMMPEKFESFFGKIFYYRDVRRQGKKYLHIFNRKLKLRFDPDLGFGEDKVFFKEVKKLPFKKMKAVLSYSRASEMDLNLVIRRYMWYGRSLPRYLKRSADADLIASLLLSSMMLLLFPFVFFHPAILILFLIPVVAYLLRGLKITFDIWQGFGVKPVFLLMPVIELLIGISLGMGFFKYLLGDRKASR